MRPADKKLVREFKERFTSAKPTILASNWCENELWLNEPKIKGKFTFNGRASLREIIDAWGPLPESLLGGRNFVFVAGTGIGKTISSIAGISFRLALIPMRALIVKPTAHGAAGARSFSKTRLIPTIRATKPLADKIPTGAERHDLASLQIIMNGSVIDVTGSNSVGQLGENRCDVVLQDEIDKYPEQTEESKEASPTVLADERTKNVIGARTYKYSTPTRSNTGIWDAFKKTDQRRRFLPCPHCDKFVVLAWSKRFTVFELTGNEAFVKWDEDAKRDGVWDYERVEKSAHYECPHCKGKIQSKHLADMDEGGKWVATAKNPVPGEIGWHLPSLYSTSPDCAVGKLAVKFLKAKRSPLIGLKGFINSDLAEPDIDQEIYTDKSGIAGTHIELTGQWFKTLSIDCQQNAPYFWWVVRAWDGKTKSHGLKCGPAHQWYELDEIQKNESIIPQGVIVDAGFDQAEVLRNCANLKIPTRCVLVEQLQDALPIADGWTPCKAYGGKRLYRDEETGLYLPYRVKKDYDPFSGSELAHMMRIEMVEFLSDVFEDMLENIRTGKTGLEWTISKDMDTDEYHKHMAGKKRVYNKNDQRSYKWQTVRPGYPDHIRFCELISIVLACRLQLISFEAIQTKEKK